MRVRLTPATDAVFAWLLGEPADPPPLRAPPGGLEEAWVLRWLRGNLAVLEGTGSWLMVDGDEVVGLCNYKGPPEADGVVEIGYAVAAAHRRRGYATAGVAALIAKAVSDSRIRALSAETALGNIASQRVLLANGFAATGRGFDRDEGEMILWSLTLPQP